MITKLMEVKLGENGCAIRTVEGGTSLCLTRGQIDRALFEGGEEGFRLFTYQEFDDGISAWVAVLQLLNEEFGPNPSRVRIEEKALTHQNSCTCVEGNGYDPRSSCAGVKVEVST